MKRGFSVILVTFYELLVTKVIDLPSVVFYHWGPDLVDGAVLYVKQYSERDPKVFYITELVEVRQNIQRQFDRVRKNMLKHSLYYTQNENGLDYLKAQYRRTRR